VVDGDGLWDWCPTNRCQGGFEGDGLVDVGAVLDAVRVSWVGCLAAPVPSDADFVAG